MSEIAFLHEGKIVLQGTLEEVRLVKKTAATELQLEQSEDIQMLLLAFPCLKSTGRNSLLLEDVGRLPDVLRFLADKRTPIVRIERQEASLEDLFMEVVGK